MLRTPFAALAILVTAGCAQLPVPPAPPDPVRTAVDARLREQQAAQRLADQFAAQLYLWRLAQALLAREDEGLAVLVTQRTMGERMRAGVARGLDVEAVSAAAQALRVELYAATAALDDARARYEARHGAVALHPVNLPRWADRLPVSLDALLAAVDDDAQVDARSTWQRARRATAVLVPQAGARNLPLQGA